MPNIKLPENIMDHDDLREYVITCVSMEDLESLYNDIETEGGSITIPNRAIEVFNRRTISKNTHYMLTSEEAIQLKNDPRVAHIQNAEYIRSSIKIASYTQTANFSKIPSSNSISSSSKNWALLRCIEGIQREGWGIDTLTYTINSTITITPTGKNVDVIIVDGISKVPDHPEFANTTNQSRYVQYDWYQLNGIVGYYPETTSYYGYDDSYDPRSVEYQNHGAHVTGIVAGNTNGWARDANIYQINPNVYFDGYGTPSYFGGIDPLMMWDYIRAFHANKSVNPSTGIKNPTICNCSYETNFTSAYWLDQGAGVPIFAQFRGDIGIGEADANGLTGRPLSEDELFRLGIPNTPSIYDGSPYFTFPYYDDGTAADISAAIDEGIIIVGAAGNASFFIDTPDGIDYNNAISFATTDGEGNITVNFTLPYHRGSAPSSVPGVITVGAISADSSEKIASYTNKGPAIDLFAPGDLIISSVATSTGNPDSGTANTDSRNASFYVGRGSGTSMAAAQVTGILACLLEALPTMTPAQALDIIKNNVTKYQIPQDANDIYYSDLPISNTTPTYFSGRVMNTNYLLGAPNKYAVLKKLRPSTGELYPPEDYLGRPSTGILYPRPNIRIVT